jgi:uncharacterized membrane protein
LPLALTATGILIVMWRRQFYSEPRMAFEPHARKRKIMRKQER